MKFVAKKMNTEIKKIRPEDTYQIRHEVMWSHKSIDFVKIADDTEGVHLGLFLEEKLVSIVSLFFKNHTVQFRKFATLVEYQGRGLGAMLLNYIFQVIENQGIKKIWCSARSEKKEFYEKFGMVVTSEPLLKNGIEYVVMERSF